MNEPDFEERLRGHLAARARLIEVPDHQFVQTKIVPFQPRRRRLDTLGMAAAGAAVIAILGFGVFQTTNGDNVQAGISDGANKSCSFQIAAGEPGFWLTINDADERHGPFASDESVSLDLREPASLTVTVYRSINLDTQVEEALVPDPHCGSHILVGSDGELTLTSPGD